MLQISFPINKLMPLITSIFGSTTYTIFIFIANTNNKFILRTTYYKISISESTKTVFK